MRIAPRVAALGLSIAVAGCGDARLLPPSIDPCHRCHGGDSGNAAPPRSTRGGMDISDPRVGAHQAHLRGGAIRGPIACSECHVVPSSIHDHIDGNASPVFGPLASARRTSPAFTRATGECAGTYCHGATLRGGTLDTPVWTTVSGTQAACGTCHGTPPPLPHPQVSACAGCHPDTVRSDGTIDIAGGQHIDGTLDGGACGSCHPVPSQSGAHRAHYGDASSPPLAAYGDLRIFEDYDPADASAYTFGCGHCHPLDPERHAQGDVDVDLSPAGAPAGSLKARNGPGAAYDPASGTCSGVYCHSTGQTNPSFAVTPAWTSGVALGCDGCHGNPPAYPSGGPGTPTANSHVNFADDGYEFGHFLGMPGVWHTTRHGRAGAAPITCQTCHFETTDSANVAPGRFYYLDTTGHYRLEGGDQFRIDSGWAAQLDCTTRHTGGPDAPPHGSGRVLPLRHVNGRRDVVFDPRTVLPSIPGLPAAPNTPTRPYWLANSDPTKPWPSDAAWNGSTVSFDLTGASYDAVTKTCSAVGCHLADTPVWGKPYGWGDGEEYCHLCHPMN